MPNDDLELTETPEIETRDALNLDDKEEVDIPVEDDKKEEVEDILDEKEEKKDDKEDEKEEELPAEDILEENDFQSIPARKEILAKYPNFYKDFPAVEKAVYREQQYAEVFPTLDDARNAQGELNQFKGLESSLLQGKSDSLLKNLRANVPGAFDKIADNFLETLSNIDEKASRKIIDKVVKHTLNNALNHGKKSQDENLQKAAQILHRAIYGSPEIDLSELKSEAPKNDDAKAQLERERQEFVSQKINSDINDVATRSENLIKSAIDKYIDPKGQMSSYIKAKAAEDAYKEIYGIITKDTRFGAHRDKLWKPILERGGGATDAEKNAIRNAIIQRAKQSLNHVIVNARNQALKGVTRKKVSEDDKPLPRQRAASSSKPNGSVPDRSKSTRELLDMD